MKNIIYGWVVLSVLFSSALAQPTMLTHTDSAKGTSAIRLGFRYTSNYLFMGRSDSAEAPYLSPSVTYYHRSGLFVRGSFSYLTSKDEARIDMVSFSGGYDYYGNNFAAGGSLSGYAFSDYSYVVLSEMKGYLNGYAAYDFGPVLLYADASLGFSGATDFFTSIEVSRTFYLVHSALQITPSVLMNAGTQQYYDQYYSERSTQTGYGKGNGSHHQQNQTTSSGYTIESTKFQILDYEADLFISYKLNNIKFFIEGTWTFPVNPATIVSDEGTYEEDLKNDFYWTTGIRFYIDFRKK